MTRVTLGVLLGVGIGIVDVLMMLPLTFPDKRAALLGAFCSRFALGFFVATVRLPLPPLISGVLVGILTSLPDAIITKTYAPILITGIVFGAVAGWWLDDGPCRPRRSERHAEQRSADYSPRPRDGPQPEPEENQDGHHRRAMPVPRINRPFGADAPDVHRHCRQQHRRLMLDTEEPCDVAPHRLAERPVCRWPERAEAEVEDQPDQDLEVERADESSGGALVDRRPRFARGKPGDRADEHHDCRSQHDPAPVAVHQPEERVRVHAVDGCPRLGCASSPVGVAVNTPA